MQDSIVTLDITSAEAVQTLASIRSLHYLLLIALSGLILLQLLQHRVAIDEMVKPKEA